MDARDFVKLLKGVKGPNSSGEWTAQCPCHDDRTASLTVRDGDVGVLIDDHGGCKTSDILAALGLTFRDIMRNPQGGEKRPPRKAKPAAPASPTPAAPAGKGKGPGELEKTYYYTDASGRALFEVLRYRTESADGKPAKTFRQRTYDPKNELAKRDGYVWKVDEAVRARALYRHPEVARAIAAGRPVYVVEGEKDADTLQALGLAATCNAGGAGKWRQGHAAALQGAEVIVIPDCDGAGNGYKGQEHGWAVASSLVGLAKRVQLIDLRPACPRLPDKGDISDWMQIFGPEAGLAELDKLVAATPEFDPKAPKYWLDEAGQAAALFARVPGYCVDEGRICQSVEDGVKPLANFVAVPREIVTVDDGVERNNLIVLDGWDVDGRPLEPARVKAQDFDGMQWITKAWDFRANLYPGTTVRDKIRFAISEVGRMTAKHVTQYAHTGWRQIGGKWAYLYQGGAIGAEGVTVDIGMGLGRYRLDGSGAEGFEALSYADGARCTLALAEVIRPQVLIPLLGVTFLAPLREWLLRTGSDPAFSLFLIGGTGTRKSTVAALAMSHFGDFGPRNAPASFHDTMNAIREKAFLIKDAVLLVDDFHPVSSLQERKKMTDTAQALSRAVGDNADRGRLTADLKVRAPRVARCMTIITGEDMPQVTASGISRYFEVAMDKDSVDVGERLTELQDQARAGYLAKCMAGYIKWIGAQIDRLPDQLHDEFIHNRALAMSKAVDGQHGRSAEAIAHIMVGYNSMLLYMRDIGVLSAEECRQRSAEAWQYVVEVSRTQAVEMRDERPSKQYIAAIAQLLASRAARVRELDNPEAPKEIKDMIGYSDGQFYYLLPEIAYRAVQKLYSDQGLVFPLGSRLLYKQLKEDGILPPGCVGKDSTTKPKFVDGRMQRLLWIPRKWIDGERSQADRQESMDFTEVEDDELPEGWDD